MNECTYLILLNVPTLKIGISNRKAGQIDLGIDNVNKGITS